MSWSGISALLQTVSSWSIWASRLPSGPSAIRSKCGGIDTRHALVWAHATTQRSKCRPFASDCWLCSDLPPVRTGRMVEEEKRGAPQKRKAKSDVPENQQRRSRRGKDSLPHSPLPSLDDGGQDVEDINKQGESQPVRAAAGRSMEERMQELQMGSLVDLSEAAAMWIVLGSTKKPYKVSIGDLDHKGSAACAVSGVRSKCQCMDFRLRKRDCKHITLLKTTLGLMSGAALAAHCALAFAAFPLLLSLTRSCVWKMLPAGTQQHPGFLDPISS